MLTKNIRRASNPPDSTRISLFKHCWTKARKTCHKAEINLKWNDEELTVVLGLHHRRHHSASVSRKVPPPFPASQVSCASLILMASSSSHLALNRLGIQSDKKRSLLVLGSSPSLRLLLSAQKVKISILPHICGSRVALCYSARLMTLSL